MMVKEPTLLAIFISPANCIEIPNDKMKATYFHRQKDTNFVCWLTGPGIYTAKINGRYPETESLFEEARIIPYCLFIDYEV
jgi:hypothetical protein